MVIMRSHKIKIPIFNQVIHIVGEEVVKDMFNHSPDDNPCDIYSALCFEDKDKRICFYYDEKYLTKGLLVHESVHLANFIIDRCLIHSTPKDDEVLAYLTQFIYEKLNKICT